jgi:hypothetical protein
MQTTFRVSTRLLMVASALAAATPVPVTAFAQNGVLSGSVATDSLGKHTLPGAVLSMPALQLTTTANFAGEYRFSGLPAGRFLVIVDVSGYKSVGERVVVGATGETYHDFVIATKATVLDTVMATAAGGAVQYRSPALRGVQERRQQGIGRFITEDQLRKGDDRLLSDVVRQHLPGGEIQMVGTASYLYTSSAQGFFPDTVRALHTASTNPKCYPAVYLDGLPMPKQTDPHLPIVTAVDLSQFSVSQLGAVEFYTAALVPPQFNSSSQGGCGVLLLWTRER